MGMMKTTAADSRVSVRVSRELRAELAKLAASAKRKFSDYVRIALEQHVARKAKKAA